MSSQVLISCIVVLILILQFTSAILFLFCFYRLDYFWVRLRLGDMKGNKTQLDVVL